MAVSLKQRKINIWNSAHKAIFYFAKSFLTCNMVSHPLSPPRHATFSGPPFLKIWDWKLFLCKKEGESWIYDRLQDTFETTTSFPAKTCLCTLCQHCTHNFLCKVVSVIHKNIFACLFSVIIQQVLLVVFLLIRGQNNPWSLDMTKCICHLISHNFSQFQALFIHFVNKKLKII